jgi:hypothetical protein
MFMVAFDPKTDFTIEPWLKQKLGHELRLGEAVGGSYVFTPEGEENIKLFGYFLSLKGNLAPTGTGLDQTMFLTFETGKCPGSQDAAGATEIPPTAFQPPGQGAAGVDPHGGWTLCKSADVTPIRARTCSGFANRSRVCCRACWSS